MMDEHDETTRAGSGPFRSVTPYGATGDGETDDTRAIQAAFVDSDNGTVVFPPGEYLINEPLEIATGEQPYHLLGTGRSELRVHPDASGNFDDRGVLDCPEQDEARITIQNLTVDANEIADFGINLWDVDERDTNHMLVDLANLRVGRARIDGVRLYRPILTSLDTVMATENGRDGFHFVGHLTTVNCNTCFAHRNGRRGFYCGVGDYFLFQGCGSDDNGEQGYLVEGTEGRASQAVSMYNCGVETVFASDPGREGWRFGHVDNIYLNSLVANGRSDDHDIVRCDAVRHLTIVNTQLRHQSPENAAVLGVGDEYDPLAASLYPEAITIIGSNLGTISAVDDLEESLHTVGSFVTGVGGVTGENAVGSDAVYRGGYGPVLRDRTTGEWRRVVLDDGELSTESW